MYCWMFYGLMIFLFQHCFLEAANFSHSYPRKGWLQWGGAVDEWYAKHDLLMNGNHNSGWAQKIHSLNPNTIILPTQDFNAGGGIAGDSHSSHSEWYSYHADGSQIHLYFDYDQFWNMSTVCPLSSSHGNKKYCEYLPEFLANKFDMNIWDGLATDGLYDSPVSSQFTAGDIDLDRNGVNDFNQYPLGWTDAVWVDGTNLICSKLRQLIPQDKYFLVNTWSWGLYHPIDVNGWVLEHARDDDGRYDLNTYLSQMQSLRTPQCILFDGVGPTPNSVTWMRYQISFASLGNGYYSYSDKPASSGYSYNEHHFDRWFDEFDVPLGYPTTDYQKVGTIFRVRFFDGGAVINCNGLNGGTITDAQLAALPGYQGPYYHFLGNQDIALNNGNFFTSVKFRSKDGVLLVRTPQVIITDLIMDNENHATTPRQNPALLTGTWTDSRDGSDYYQLSSADWVNLFKYKYSNQGSGENTAMYRASIYVEGKYKVYEWHGTLSGAASNVPCLVKHKNGFFQTTINQTISGGRWNLLGEFDFVANSVDSSYVLITNNANGRVTADAVKFVSTAPIYTPPVSIAQPAERKIMQPGLKIQNYPNPFVSTTRITIEGLTPEEFLMARPLLQIYDVQGVLVKEAQLPGAEFVFESKNFGAGIYWVKVALAGTVYSHKMYLVK